eukprot:CAMPEP_0202025036 /NCGR_PEP_ID=MMETSP0905-20130828/55516_1 /ASSEMBLY_ACC=CAM_ASM_000554 /TAXON_ID=420261 /ORGANISM="Thalassiosira antarctica, Strain CCMP982" /LENGTH=406 /DNA_ID=CAMNT_0048587829 /DNA_START=37 /DNA_END=1257 /DNA_ORIENTATION=+
MLNATRTLLLLCLAYICDAYSSWNPFQRPLRQSNNHKDAIPSHHASRAHHRSSTGANLPLHMSNTASIDRTTTTPPSTTTPLSPMTFAGQVEQALLSKFQESKIERVLQSWRLLELDYEHREFVGNQQSPPITDADTSSCYQLAPSYVPGLKAVAWWDDVDQLSWANSLSKSYPAIRDEFMSVMSNPDKLQSDGNNIWAGALTTDAESYGDGWKTLVLLNRGQWDDTNAKLFPITSKAIHKSGVPVAEAFFASMKPQTSIKPHSDFTNFVLTSHIPLVIPENGNNKCRLSVGDETRQWLEGKVILFDTSIYHDAVNESEEMRYILMLRVWHPDLTKEERGALQLIYDCLEIPELLSTDPGMVVMAEQRANMMREFPLKDEGGGFGGSRLGGNKGKKGKGKNKKKGR